VAAAEAEGEATSSSSDARLNREVLTGPSINHCVVSWNLWTFCSNVCFAVGIREQTFLVNSSTVKIFMKDEWLLCESCESFKFYLFLLCSVVSYLKIQIHMRKSVPEC